MTQERSLVIAYAPMDNRELAWVSQINSPQTTTVEIRGSVKWDNADRLDYDSDHFAVASNTAGDMVQAAIDMGFLACAVPFESGVVFALPETRGMLPLLFLQTALAYTTPIWIEHAGLCGVAKSWRVCQFPPSLEIYFRNSEGEYGDPILLHSSDFGGAGFTLHAFKASPDAGMLRYAQRLVSAVTLKA